MYDITLLPFVRWDLRAKSAFPVFYGLFWLKVLIWFFRRRNLDCSHRVHIEKANWRNSDRIFLFVVWFSLEVPLFEIHEFSLHSIDFSLSRFFLVLNLLHIQRYQLFSTYKVLHEAASVIIKLVSNHYSLDLVKWSKLEEVLLFAG